MAHRQNAERHSYMERKANHSTKPFKTGDNSHLAEIGYDFDYRLERYSEMAKFHNSLIGERQILVDKKIKLETRCGELSLKLKDTLTYKQYDKLEKERRELGVEMQRVNSALALNRRRRKDLPKTCQGSHHYVEGAFMDAAKHILPDDVFRAISDSAREVVKDRLDSQGFELQQGEKDE